MLTKLQKMAMVVWLRNKRLRQQNLQKKLDSQNQITTQQTEQDLDKFETEQPEQSKADTLTPEEEARYLEMFGNKVNDKVGETFVAFTNKPKQPEHKESNREITDKLLKEAGATRGNKTGSILMPLSQEQRESMTNSQEKTASQKEASQPQEFPLTPKDYLAIHKLELTDQGFININNKLSEEAFARFEDDIENFIKFEEHDRTTLIEKINSLPADVQKKVRRYAYQKAFKLKLHEIN